MDLLEALAKAGGEVPIRELGETVGIKTATAYNLLQTLKAKGYVMQSSTTKAYSLGIRLIHLAEAVDPRLSLGTAAMPYLREAAARLGETVYISIPVHRAIYRVAVAESPQRLSVKATIGESHDDLMITSSGKVFLAYMGKEFVGPYLAERGAPDSFTTQLAGIREKGYAVNQGEHNPEICGISVPVFKGSFGAGGELSLILTASIPRTRFSEDRIVPIVDELKGVGDQVMAQVGLSRSSE